MNKVCAIQATECHCPEGHKRLTEGMGLLMETNLWLHASLAPKALCKLYNPGMHCVRQTCQAGRKGSRLTVICASVPSTVVIVVVVCKAKEWSQKHRCIAP